MGIPVGVVDDDSVGARQVDAETSGPCGQQEAELLSARCCSGRKQKLIGGPVRLRGSESRVAEEEEEEEQESLDGPTHR